MRLPLTITLLALAAGGAWGQTSTLHVVEENGPRSQRINLVFLSEGYTVSDLPNFAGHVQNAVNFLFSREPWQQYRSYCNIYRIEIASNESGTDNGTGGGLKDTYFHSTFSLRIPRLLSLTASGQSRAYSVLGDELPEYDIPIVLVNDPEYGGSGGPISVASIHQFGPYVVEHEIGHSFAGLADEYYEYAGTVPPSEHPNTTRPLDPENPGQIDPTNPDLIKWRDWFEPSTPIPTPEDAQYDSAVGSFEGSMYTPTGWYRPHFNSVMRNLGRPCGQINCQEFVLTYYESISPIDGWMPESLNQSVDGPQPLSFSVTPLVPSSGVTLDVTWKLDGTPLPGEIGPSLNLVSDIAGNGSHTLTAEVHDPTTFVRTDPGNLLTDTTSWTLTLTNQLPNTVAGWRSQFGGDSENPTGDGLKNLIKYALGLDPSSSVRMGDHIRGILSEDSGSGVQSQSENGERYLTLSIPRRLRRTDVEMIVEVSSDLTNWFSGPPHTVTVTDSDTLLVVRDTTPVSSGIRRYMRLKVTPVE